MPEWLVGVAIGLIGAGSGIFVAWINRSGGREDRIVATLREDNKALRGRVADLESREYTFLDYIDAMREAMANAGIAVPPFPDELKERVRP